MKLGGSFGVRISSLSKAIMRDDAYMGMWVMAKCFLIFHVLFMINAVYTDFCKFW